MFNLRKNRFQSRDSLNRRKLWEEFLNWGNALNTLDSDTMRFRHFERDAFHNDIKITINGTAVNNRKLTVTSGGAYYGVLEFTKPHYNGPGEYLITWSLGGEVASSSSCYIVAAYPFIGNQLLRELGDSAEHPSVYADGTLDPALVDHYFPDETLLTLCGSGVTLIDNESTRAGIFFIGNQGAQFRADRCDISLMEWKQ